MRSEDLLVVFGAGVGAVVDGNGLGEPNGAARGGGVCMSEGRFEGTDAGAGTNAVVGLDMLTIECWLDIESFLAAAAANVALALLGDIPIEGLEEGIDTAVIELPVTVSEFLKVAEDDDTKELLVVTAEDGDVREFFVMEFPAASMELPSLLPKAF
jgi:hypothetical protein